MRILITGGLGHIGSYLLENFPNDFEIIVADNMFTQRYPVRLNLAKKITEFHEVDLSKVDISNLIKRSDLVIHLSAITDAAGTADKPKIVFDNNFEATKRIVDGCSKSNIPLVFPSSTSVYGSQESLVDENCRALNPQSPYAESKLLEENYVAEMLEKYFILRFGTIHGCSQGMRFHTAVNKFCWQSAHGQGVTVWKSAWNQLRPYLGLQDVLTNLLKIVNLEIPPTGQVLNFVSENSSPEEIVSIIRRRIPQCEVNFVDHAIMNQLSYEVSNINAQKLGFTFENSLERDINETLNYLIDGIK
jgi:nucleoside-diphosphate-sugar epimerase